MTQVLKSIIATDWYWIVGDTTPAANVFSSASRGFVANNAAAFLTWLAQDLTGAAGGMATAMDISAAADNGGGFTRLTLADTSLLTTGQRFYFGTSNGVQQITVIDATHIDLLGLAFGSYVSTATMFGATIIDTAANLYDLLNKFSIFTFPPNHQVVSFTGTTATLTNPIATVNTFDTTTANAKIVLPIMTDPKSLSIGDELVFKNIAASATSKQVDILAQDGSTRIATAYQGDIVSLALKDNSTANGTWTVSVSQIGNALGQHVGARINTSSGATTASMVIDAAIVRDKNGQSRAVLFSAASSATLDITTAGPALNGRDQAAAFSAGDILYIYFIWGQGQTSGFIASKLGGAQPWFSGPTLPTNYTHWCFLFKVQLNSGAVTFPRISSGTEFGDVLHPGTTTIPSAATITLDSNFWKYEVSGNTNISAINSGSYLDGKTALLVFTAPGGQLVHGAGSFELPGSANITWATGDACLIGDFVGTPKVLAYWKADGSAVAGMSAAAYTFRGNPTGSTAAEQAFTITGLTEKSVPSSADYLVLSDEAASSATKKVKPGSIAGPLGGGILLFSSATALTFTPYNGDRIKINGKIYAIPSGGITGLANTSVFVAGVGGQNLAASTTYNVYAFDNSGTVTADFVTDATAHATSSTAGNVGTEIKSGDDTRSLIGKIRTNGSSQFTTGLVATWFNRRVRSSRQALANFTTTSTTSASLTTAVTPFISWGDQAMFALYATFPFVNVAGQFGIFYIDDSDGAIFNRAVQEATANINSNDTVTPWVPTEGYKTMTLKALSSTSTTTLTLSNNAISVVGTW